MLCKYLFSVGALYVLLCTSQAASAAGEGHIHSVRERYDISFNTAGTYASVIDYTWRAVDLQGAATLGQQYLVYDVGRQEIEVLDAETISAQAGSIKVPKSDIKIQDGVLGGVSYPEQKLLQITFPKLAAGDSIRLRYRFVQKLPDLPGGTSRIYYFYRDMIRDDVAVTLRYPQSLALKVAYNDLTPVDEQIEGEQHWLRLKFSSTDTVLPEPISINSWQQTPYIMMSTYADWKAIADAYQQGAAEKAGVTPEVEALADEITKGATSQREQAKLLYDWVRKNIRYVASYVGNGGWIPNDTGRILKTHYGDCKDHSTLLEALLEARGIPASQVLIYADTENYLLPPIASLWFNHAINYLPTLGLFLDSTDSQMPFGILPETDSDKPVLVTKNFETVARTPIATIDNFKMNRRVHIKFAVDGSAVRTSEIDGYGRAAAEVRSFIEDIGPGQEPDWVKKTMAESGLDGEGTLQIVKSSREDVLGFRYTEKIRNYVNQPEAGVLAFAPGVTGPISLGKILRRFTQPERTADVKCDAFAVNDLIDIEMPDAMQVLYLPKDVSMHEGPIFFEAHYERIGNLYRLNRKWGSNSGKSWCSAQEYRALRPVMNRIDKALGARLVFVMKEDSTAAVSSSSAAARN
ncbi:DUF3857 and transglutaminase domain-containing protein [Undibacterium sp.]|uniref:DUF3857 domain-containing transglutaminase family protein n=1 Tax=Undibacterium sp. TaxID=1914977 RepID=UPI002CA31E37|nr:DUF3857 and transglutaminase domain-containing protein [Undibacterium sp.]HTD05775.1 DUF3857 and transglutaminase domain-containing protein [Undibacterium sp.]